MFVLIPRASCNHLRQMSAVQVELFRIKHFEASFTAVISGKIMFKSDS